jgi:hypothetical protein
MKFHHIGIPTRTKRANETYLQEAKLFITDPVSHPYRIEWLRYEEGSPMPPELQTIAHVAYEVASIGEAMKGKQTLLEPFRPLPGLTVAFIIEDGAPIELMEFDKKG